MSDSPNSKTPDSSLSKDFAEQSAKQPPELGVEFREAHVYPIMNSEFRKSAKAKDRNKHLSKPAPTLTPKGATTVRKEMPTEAEQNIDPAKLPKMVKQPKQLHQEFTQVVGRHRQQEQQKERER